MAKDKLGSMATFQEAENQEHESLVRMMADYFGRQNYSDVKADLTSWPMPDSIGNHVPDVTGINPDGKLIVLEAETCRGIFDSHSESQWTTFDTFVAQDRARREFHVAVPRQCVNETGPDSARRRARELRIAIDKIWTPPS